MIPSALACLMGLAAALLASPGAAQQRIPIDLGPDAPTTASPPRKIDLTAPAPSPAPAEPAAIKACEERREAGVVAGEIVVCGEPEQGTAQFYSGSREAWLKGYAERTQGANTIATPDVAGAGIFRGPATIAGLCLIPPCPKQAALMIDVAAIPPPPAGSDAERVAQGLDPLHGDDAPLDEEARRRIDTELGLPPVPPAPRP
ncbi:MAG: hypothetical protein ACK4IS_09205 [Erythrobacter sp.]